MHKHDDIPVLSTGLANKLLQKGYVMRFMTKNHNDPTKLVFYFKYDEQLIQLIEDYKKLFHN